MALFFKNHVLVTEDIFVNIEPLLLLLSQDLKLNYFKTVLRHSSFLLLFIKGKQGGMLLEKESPRFILFKYCSMMTCWMMTLEDMMFVLP